MSDKKKIKANGWQVRKFVFNFLTCCRALRAVVDRESLIFEI